MRPTMLKQKDLAPVRTFGKATAQCSAQAGAYGRCVVSNYENVERNMCQKEFLAFKACVQEKLGRKW